MTSEALEIIYVVVIIQIGKILSWQLSVHNQ